ncbi:hypothetical protein ACFL3Z_02400 [Gemmatimonadota bacterium]
MKRVSVLALLAFVGAAILTPTVASAQQANIPVPDWIQSLRLPNGGGKAMLSPTGWGAAYQTVFAGFGIQNPTPFADEADGGIGFGIGLWDPVLFVGIQVVGSMVDVSEMGEFTVGVKVHRYLGYGTSIAVGAETIYETLEGEGPAGYGGDPDPSFYGVISHTLQNVDGATPGSGRVHFSIGIGDGRFADMPLRTVEVLGKEDATWVFGNVAVELVKNLNVIGEWDGTGLNGGVAYTMPIGPAVGAVTLGVADILEYSTDQPRLIFGGGLAFTLF